HFPSLLHLIMASWGSLPSTAIDRICYNLLDYEDCSDVDHLSMVSKNFFCGVMQFMGRAKNRPSTEKMEIVKEEAGLTVEVSLSSSFLPYYGLATLDKGRFERVGPAAHPRLRVTLSGPEDPIIEQVSGLLSASIHEVSILLRPVVPVSDLSLCSQLLRNSPIAKITIDTPMREEEIGPSILSIASHARRQPQPNRGDGTVRSGRLHLPTLLVAHHSPLPRPLGIRRILRHRQRYLGELPQPEAIERRARVRRRRQYGGHHHRDTGADD
ncbi:hypothetical protein PMAYCL1PPCAC_01925, partial [Pristionchus mayeri]